MARAWQLNVAMCCLPFCRANARPARLPAPCCRASAPHHLLAPSATALLLPSPPTVYAANSPSRLPRRTNRRRLHSTRPNCQPRRQRPDTTYKQPAGSDPPANPPSIRPVPCAARGTTQFAQCAYPCSIRLVPCAARGTTQRTQRAQCASQCSTECRSRGLCQPCSNAPASGHALVQPSALGAAHIQGPARERRGTGDYAL